MNVWLRDNKGLKYFVKLGQERNKQIRGVFMYNCDQYYLQVKELNNLNTSPQCLV